MQENNVLQTAVYKRNLVITLAHLDYWYRKYI